MYSPFGFGGFGFGGFRIFPAFYTPFPFFGGILSVSGGLSAPMRESWAHRASDGKKGGGAPLPADGAFPLCVCATDAWAPTPM